MIVMILYLFLLKSTDRAINSRQKQRQYDSEMKGKIILTIWIGKALAHVYSMSEEIFQPQTHFWEQTRSDCFDS